MNFKQHNNPLDSLDVGKRQLIKNWLDEMEVTNYTINDDFAIDVDGYVNLRNRNLVEFPEYIQFNEVAGFFDCSYNKLISLRGCPKIVHASFYCDHNNLDSLEGCPKTVKGDIYCYCNKKIFTEEDIKIFYEKY